MSSNRPTRGPGPNAINAIPDVWADRVAGTPISSVTLLGTDYLNHFNEVIMLIGMIPSMPDVLDDLREWKPKTYPEHFRTSNLDYGELAAEAYDHVPPSFKEPFEATVRQLSALAHLTIKRLSAMAATSGPDQLAQTATSAVTAMTALVASADAIIAGGREVLQQDAVDRLLGA
jgi:hypothetical protein